MEIYEGTLVKLDPIDAENDSADIAAWIKDGEYARLEDASLAVIYPVSATREYIEKQLKTGYYFSIWTRKECKMIGFLEVDGINWPAREGWVGIGIGDREFRGKGYGTDAMRLALRFAFLELNLNRISLTVFEYNQRGIRSYEKVGFKEEGRERQALERDGKRWDMIFMGILKSEWEPLSQK